jgi:hypothetical protein
MLYHKKNGYRHTSQKIEDGRHLAEFFPAISGPEGPSFEVVHISDIKKSVEKPMAGFSTH